MKDVNLDKVHLAWCMDIIKRIKEIVDNPSSSEKDKLEQIKWLSKQALKVERED